MKEMRYSSASLEITSGPKTDVSGGIAVDVDGSVPADEAGLTVGAGSSAVDREGAP